MKKIVAFCLFVLIPYVTYPFSYFLTIEGERYFGNIKKETDTYYMIELENENRVIKLFKNKLVLIEHEENGLEVYKPEYCHKVNPDSATQPFFDKANGIYIPISSSKIAQRSGSGTLKMFLVNDTLWNIVDTEEQAHYIMRYVFDERGSDKAYINVSDREGNTVYVSPKISARDPVPWHAGEESAEKLYKLLKKVVRKK